MVAVDPAPPDLATGLRALGEQLGDAGGSAVLLVSTSLHVHPEALADLALDPRHTTMALVSTGGAGVRDLRVRAGRVVAVGTATHAVTGADTAYAGALRVASGDVATALAVAAELVGLAQSRAWTGDPLDLLLLGLVRREVAVGTMSLDPWPWVRGDGTVADGVQQRLDAMTPPQVRAARLARATKAEDGVTATLVHRPMSRRLTPVALRLGLHPNQVTALSVAVGLAAAGAFAVGSRPALVIGALLLQASFVLDCVDGEVARYNRAFSATGAWLDASTDRLKEFACYGGLAWGAVGAGRSGWLLAAAMLTLQTVRHTVDYTFTAVKDLRETDVVALPLEDVGGNDVGAADAGAGEVGDERAAWAIARSEQAGSRHAVTVVKKLMHLGIGERWLVLSLLAALGLPLVALGVLLLLGLVSLAYTSAGRSLRARSWPRRPVSARERDIVRAQVDAGPLVPRRAAERLAGPEGGPSRWLWVRPALLRLGEYAGVLVLTLPLGERAWVPAAAFLLLLVTASHHYDELYRVLGRLAPPPRLSAALGLGLVGRLLVVAVLALLAGRADPAGALGRGGLWVLAGALGMLFLVVEPARVLTEVRRRPALDPATGAAGA